MKLHELKVIKPKSDDIARKLRISKDDAELAVQFVRGETDWEDLSDDARVKLYSYYQKTFPYGTDEENATDPKKFIAPALKKEFMIEGGKATEKHGTVRATQADMQAALKYVSKYSGIPVEVLADRLLGSARLTYNGKQEDSGDVDIAIDETKVDKQKLVDRLEFASGIKAFVIGDSTYSFAIPVGEKRKVQVDLMFVPDVEWAKFSHYASEHSKHKSGVRNELLHSALKWSMEDGKDVRVKDVAGNDIVRASRAYKLDQGVERIFKVAKQRKDGKGRVKSPSHATPEEVQQALGEIGHEGKFSPKTDTIRDPNKFAKLLFGARASAKDLMSTEQLITMIKKYKGEHADEIFKDAVKGIKRLKFPVPDELKQYE